MKFRRLPIEIEAIQFTGDNWAEMHDFTGHYVDGRGKERDIFIGNGPNSAPGGLESGSIRHGDEFWQYVGPGYWVIKQAEGFGILEDHEFQATHVDDEEFQELKPAKDGEVREIDETSTDARILGRIHMSLMLTRPDSETEAIMNRLIYVFARHKVFEERDASV